MTRESSAVPALLLALAGCAAGGPGSESPYARVASTSSKADGDEGAAYWEVYADGDSMTWVGVRPDGGEDRLFFRSADDAVWLDVDRDGLPLGTLGVAMSGEVLASPDEAALHEVGLLLDEALQDSNAVAVEADKADGAGDVPRMCRGEEQLTAGQVLRACVGTFGALWRLTTGSYDGDGVGAVFQILADIVTPAACSGGLASLVGWPGSLSSYCESPGRFEIRSATLTCNGAFRDICQLSLDLRGTGNLPGEILQGEMPRIEVYSPTGVKDGWGFADRGEGARWSDSIDVWHVDPNLTYRVIVSGDFLVTAETTVRVSR